MHEAWQDMCKVRNKTQRGMGLPSGSTITAHPKVVYFSPATLFFSLLTLERQKKKNPACKWYKETSGFFPVVKNVLTVTQC